MPIQVSRDAREITKQKRKRRSSSNDLQDDAKHPRLSRDDDGKVDIQDLTLASSECIKGFQRFATVSDCSRDCAALPITKSFVDRMADISEQSQGLTDITNRISLLEQDAEHLELSIRILRRSADVTEGQTLPEELHTAFSNKASKLDRVITQLRDLKRAYYLAERRLGQSRNDTHHVLEKVMEAANLLRPTQRVPTFDVVENTSEENGIRGSTGSNSRSSADAHEEKTSLEETIRRAARIRLEECARYYYNGQAQFDDQKRHYEQNLAWYNQGAVEGTFTHSRSEFDRRAVVYGQQLTDALIDAEAAFESARDEARAVHATESTAELPHCGSHCRTSFSPPAEYLAPYNATHDWSFIEAWRSNVGAGGGSIPTADIDEWDAKTVEISDSVSAIDNERFVKQIVRWQAHCGELTTPSRTGW